MQAPTHLLAGVLIQKGFDWKQHRRLAFGLTAVCAFLSHGLLDKLANLTYHRANPDFHSPIWVAYHAALIPVTLLFLYWWWKPYKWGIIFACLPDVDWVFIHGQEIFHFHIPFYRQPHLHHLLGLIYNQLPPFAWLNRLPNCRNNPWAILPEAALLIVVAAALRVKTRRSQSGQAPSVAKEFKSAERASSDTGKRG
jgi:hypothetical protein